MKADKSALGNIPLSAFQYCEAMRVASSLGWYVFSPFEFSLSFDGKEVFIADEGQWRPLHNEPFPPEVEEVWSENLEEEYGPLPDWITSLPDTGVVQVFTGLFISTNDDIWCHIKPLVNINKTNSYWCYEGIVETDTFSPAPLFVNIQMAHTNSEIYFSSEMPLFQLTCVPKSIVATNSASSEGSICDPNFPKEGLLHTLRRQPGAKVSPGAYASNVRKREKRERS